MCYYSLTYIFWQETPNLSDRNRAYHWGRNSSQSSKPQQFSHPQGWCESQVLLPMQGGGCSAEDPPKSEDRFIGQLAPLFPLPNKDITHHSSLRNEWGLTSSREEKAIVTSLGEVVSKLLQKDAVASRTSSYSNTVVLNLWVATPVGVSYQIYCISVIYIMIHNPGKISVTK